MRKRSISALVWVLAIGSCWMLAIAQSYRLPDVTYMDQPTGIELSVYLATWPSLEPFITRLKTSTASAVEADLHLRVAAADVSDGELNLLAQLERQRGALGAADMAMTRASALQPNQPLHAFQQAMIAFARLRHASGQFQQWKWQGKTRDAYQHTFDLDPLNVSARYYLAYTYMNTPMIGGGDKKKALELSEDGIALGQQGFYVVRADAHRLRGEREEANADYDRSIKLRVFKLSDFLDAGEEELRRNELEHAKRYLNWALYCRPDAAKAHEAITLRPAIGQTRATLMKPRSRKIRKMNRLSTNSRSWPRFHTEQSDFGDVAAGAERIHHRPLKQKVLVRAEAHLRRNWIGLRGSGS